MKLSKHEMTSSKNHSKIKLKSNEMKWNHKKTKKHEVKSFKKRAKKT